MSEIEHMSDDLIDIKIRELEETLKENGDAKDLQVQLEELKIEKQRRSDVIESKPISE